MKLRRICCFILLLFSLTACEQINQVETPTIKNTVSNIPPSKTLTPLPSIKPTVTYTLEPSATPTLEPREWSQNECEHFLLSGNYPVQNLALIGWIDHDGTELLDDYPSYMYYNGFKNEGLDSERIVKDACKENNSADFWCEWTCQGLFHGFGPMSRFDRISNYYLMNSLFGNPNNEPYCPQFSVTGDSNPDFYFYRDFKCLTYQPRPTPVPRESLGWSSNIRKSIEDNYLWSILNDEFIYDGFYRGIGDGPLGSNESIPASRDWNIDDVASLTDTEVCWIIANGHYLHGYPEFNPADEEKQGYLRHDMRMQLRSELEQALGESKDGSPPLCPGFLEMIDKSWIHQ